MNVRDITVLKPFQVANLKTNATLFAISILANNCVSAIAFNEWVKHYISSIKVSQISSN